MKSIKIPLILLIIAGFISISILSTPLATTDEWINYYNAYKIYEGEIIYKDVNVISTPLLFYITVLLFKILGPKLIVFRIFNIIINMAIGVTIYRILTNLNVKKVYALLYTLILEFIFIVNVTLMGATYNVLAILLCLIGINLYINNYKIKYNTIKQGIIIFLILLSKQNIGCYYIIALIITELIINGKKGFKGYIKTLITTIVLSIIYINYLKVIGILDGFISYTILGIKEFTRNFLLSAYGLIVIDILLVIFIIFSKYKVKYSEQQKRNINILLIFGICMLPIGYPIADLWHMIVASIVLIIGAIYTIHINLIIELNIEEKNVKIIICAIAIFMILISVIAFISYKKIVCIEKENMFYLIGVESEMQERIERIEKYLLNSDKKVIIASPEAGMYKINIGLNGDGIFDLPFLGNLGKEGEDLLINKITQYNDIYLLIDYSKYYQESIKFRNYVDANYETVGNVGDFKIYHIE